MHSRIIPPIEKLKKQEQLSEKTFELIDYLDKNLNRDLKWTPDKKLEYYNGWLIFVRPFLNEYRPDIVLFNPRVGIWIISIFDWDLAKYHWKRSDDGKISLKNIVENEECEVLTPYEKATSYKEMLIGRLIPMLGERANKNTKQYGLVKVLVLFERESTKTVREFFRENPKESEFIINHTFGYDALDNQNLCFEMNRFVKNDNWPQSVNKEVYYWLKPPYHSIEQGEYIELDTDQKKIAFSQSGHYRVRGVAGSGKSLALAFRAASIASAGKRVLVLTFNITLPNYIHDLINRIPIGFYWELITLTHFHGFCSNIINRYGYKLPEYPENPTNSCDTDLYEERLERYFTKEIPEKTLSVLKAIKWNYTKYDAILIDEGQDFYIEWYSLLSRYFLNESDEMLVVVDKKQNLYSRNLDWFDKRSKNLELAKFKTSIIDLKRSFRLPGRIAKLANDFSKNFGLDDDIRIEKYQIKDREVNQIRAFYSDHIIWKNIDDAKFVSSLYEHFLKLKEEKFSISDIIILLPTHKIGCKCAEFFESKGINVNHVFENEIERGNKKKCFGMKDGRLKMATIHSFKGWELLNIIIYIPKYAYFSFDTQKYILYTAITRARKNLFILNADPRFQQFGEKLPHYWDEQDVY